MKTTPQKRRYDRAWYKRNRKRVLKQCKEYYRTHTEQTLAYQRKWRKSHPEKYLLTCARKRAKDLGLKFNLVESDIRIPTHCPILGVRLYKLGGMRRNSSSSVDRFNPKLGYIRGNIAVISWKANQLKSNITDPNVFVRLAKYMKGIR